ncbi:MAG: TolC family protein, partial [Myxococcales bacterium]|nr:TolC family protein [Myxococcales bacterium]
MGNYGAVTIERSGCRPLVRWAACAALLCTSVAGGSVARGQGHADSPDLPLSRADAFRWAVRDNAGILAARYERRAGQLASGRAWRGYVPRVFVEGAYDDGTAFDPDRARERAVDSSVGALWRTPYGTEVEAAVGARERLSGSIGDAHQPSASLALRQNLLRGGWKYGVGAAILEAELDGAVAVEAFRSELNRFLVDVEVAYWSLAFAQADIEIKLRSVGRARRQYEDTKENIRLGIIAEGEIYVVEENLVFFEQQMNQAEQRLRLAQ